MNYCCYYYYYYYYYSTTELLSYLGECNHCDRSARNKQSYEIVKARDCMRGRNDIILAIYIILTEVQGTVVNSTKCTLYCCNETSENCDVVCMCVCYG